MKWIDLSSVEHRCACFVLISDIRKYHTRYSFVYFI